MDTDNLRFSGKLVAHISDNKTIHIPDGIETLGEAFLVPEFSGNWDTSVEKVYIPASVRSIEEGAFVNSNVSSIIIDPDSPCGIIKDKVCIQRTKKLCFGFLKATTKQNMIMNTSCPMALQESA